ncbi:hypothetical protein PHYBOEH_003762 [Phytophthora boehmeriae]|uniref:BART domain-containing protein n=1 Tax=Phytophthora boehmeriae TaxID=109152 RepID=A0A8T1WPS4_9STRA|nr:hypothetical protein PHYBOEH_003762 [Phytophthora boehmeriae]
MDTTLVFTAEESDWVFDYVLNLFRSPAWELPVMCFIDDNCASFDTDEENKFIYTELHTQFRELVETVLGSHLAEMGLTGDDFASICEKQRDSERAAGVSVADGVSADVVNQILAMDDFLSFKKLMVKRNLELELEAIKELREEVTEDEHDLEAQFMELSVLYKQEEMEQAELEAALAMSMCVQDEQLRMASVAAKVAEDKHASAMSETRQLSPAEVQQQMRDSKKKAEEICKRNKESLEENRNKQREWQQAAEISAVELKRREEYLKKQRDRIIEKKKKEREAQLKEYQKEQKATAPEPPSQLAEKLQSNAPEEAKNAEEEERRNALRVALARRMKQDLLESSNVASASDPSRSGSFKVHQVVELDEKLQRVEDLRRQSQERENKVQAKLRGGFSA